jgi:hypothetical protein
VIVFFGGEISPFCEKNCEREIFCHRFSILKKICQNFGKRLKFRQKLAQLPITGNVP